MDSAFEANREAVGPHSRVSIDHFQSDCFERDANADLVSGLGLGLCYSFLPAPVFTVLHVKAEVDVMYPRGSRPTHKRSHNEIPPAFSSHRYEAAPTSQ